MLERRMGVLRGLLRSEEVYLRQLDALLTVKPPNPKAFSLTVSLKLEENAKYEREVR